MKSTYLRGYSRQLHTQLEAFHNNCLPNCRECAIAGLEQKEELWMPLEEKKSWMPSVKIA